MLRKRILIWLIAAVLWMVPGQLVLAEEVSKTQEQNQISSAEIFINSNALNSMVTLKNEDETVSGPGNKVLANLKNGSTFEVVLEAAEGSEVLAFIIKIQNIETGEVSDMIPMKDTEEHKVYRLPDSGQYRVFGEVYFGDPSAVSAEEAVKDIEEKVKGRLQTAVKLPEEAEAEDLSIRDTVSEAGPNPSTGSQNSVWIIAGLIVCILTAVIILKENKNGWNRD